MGQLGAGGCHWRINQLSRRFIAVAPFNMSKGIWGNDTLFSKDYRNIMWTPHNNFAVEHTNPNKTSDLVGYGLNWQSSDYKGHFKVSHTGALGLKNIANKRMAHGLRAKIPQLIRFKVLAIILIKTSPFSGCGLGKGTTCNPFASQY